MEERAENSVGFRGMHIRLPKLSPMSALAGLSIIAVLLVATWQLTAHWNEEESSSMSYVRAVGHTGASGSSFNWQRTPARTLAFDETAHDPSDPEGLANIGENIMGTLIGSYVTMKDAGTYLPSSGERIATSIAAELRANISYTLYSARDIEIDASPSLERMLAYRSDLRIALEPLLENTSYELEVFGHYLDSGDKNDLKELERTATNYSRAIENTVEVIVPQRAVQHHLGILNALSEFEAVLSALTRHADDPFASAALLRTLNDAESEMFLSFNALARYFRTQSS